MSIVQLDPSTAPGTIIQLPDGTTAQVMVASPDGSGTAAAATGVHTLAEVATAVSAQNQQQVRWSFLNAKYKLTTGHETMLLFFRRLWSWLERQPVKSHRTATSSLREMTDKVK